jgi:hypothetical protein
MQAAIDRVMKTYGMIVNLTRDEESAARKRVTAILLINRALTKELLLLRDCDICEALGILKAEDERYI